ncbi:MAG: hypothetical protein ACP5FT_01285 [Acidilobus sp.]
MNRQGFEDKVVAVVTGLNVLALAVMLYGYVGTDVIIGYYHGEPVLYYVPTAASVVGGLLLVAIGFLLMLAANLDLRAHERVVLAIALLAFSILVAGTVAAQVSGLPKLSLLGGREDSYVIQVTAARELLAGVNPYEVNYTGFLLRSTPATKLTFIFSGGPPYTISRSTGIVDVLDYPAFSFLYYVPAVALGLPGNLWDALALGSSLVVVFLRAKRPIRWLLLMVLASGIFYFVVDPVTFDPLSGWLAPLLIATSFFSSPVVAGVMLGLAASYRQYAAAAALVYFPLAYRRGVRKLGLGVISMLMTVVLVNLPFLLVTGPKFIHDVLAPASLNFDIEGLGLSSLYFVTGHVIPRTYLILTAAALLFMTPFITYLFYDRLGGLSYLLPSLAFLAYPRPLYSYWLWFAFIGAIDFVINDLGRLEGVELREEPIVQASAASALVAVVASLVTLYFMGAKYGGLLLGASLLAALCSLALMGLYRPFRGLSYEVPVLLLGGLALYSLVVRRYATTPEVNVQVPLSLVTARLLRPRCPSPLDLMMGNVKGTLTYQISFMTSYGSHLSVPSLQVLRPAAGPLITASSTIWTAVVLSTMVITLGLVMRRVMLTPLVAVVAGVAVFSRLDWSTSAAIFALLIAGALRGPLARVRPVLEGVAAVLSPVGLMGALVMAGKDLWRASVREVIAVVLSAAAVAAALKGGYLLSLIEVAPKLLSLYLKAGLFQVMLLIAEAMIFVGPSALAVFIRFHKLSGWVLPAASVGVLALMGVANGSLAFAALAFTILASTSFMS